MRHWADSGVLAVTTSSSRRSLGAAVKIAISRSGVT